MNKKLYRKNWLDNRSRKMQNKKYHRIKACSYTVSTKSYNTNGTERSYIRNINESTKIVPLSFSFMQNTNETINFFYDIVQEIKQKKYKNIFCINSYNVELVTVDALIYLIAIMQNIKINFEMQYTFKGNLPANENARAIYNESGFMTYVKSKVKRLPNSTNKMTIISGSKNDPQVAKSMCEFVMLKLNKNMLEVLSLQKILIELMSNVYHHAYNYDDIANKRWYIYAENIDNYVRFVFVDTGAGIARTVRKNFIEKLSGKASDGDLIYSTLSGDFRTETKEKHRGNGLSGVRELATNGIFNNFTVISGSGSCSISNNSKNLIKNDYNNKIYGTIYMFDVV